MVKKDNHELLLLAVLVGVILGSVLFLTNIDSNLSGQAVASLDQGFSQERDAITTTLTGYWEGAEVTTSYFVNGATIARIMIFTGSSDVVDKFETRLSGTIVGGISTKTLGKWSTKSYRDGDTIVVYYGYGPVIDSFLVEITSHKSSGSSSMKEPSDVDYGSVQYVTTLSYGTAKSFIYGASDTITLGFYEGNELLISSSATDDFFYDTLVESQGFFDVDRVRYEYEVSGSVVKVSLYDIPEGVDPVPLPPRNTNSASTEPVVSNVQSLFVPVDGTMQQFDLKDKRIQMSLVDDSTEVIFEVFVDGVLRSVKDPVTSSEFDHEGVRFSYYRTDGDSFATVAATYLD